MELRLGLEYLGDKTGTTGINWTNSATGFTPLYAGFKLKIREQQYWIPSTAFLGALVLPFTANELFKTEHSGANMRFSFSHIFSNRVSLGYNLGVEWDGETAIPGYLYSVSLGINIARKLGSFIESYGIIPEEGGQEHLADAGLTYLLKTSLQLDVSGGLGLHDVSNSFISGGFSYRFPK
jgi:hypothetical protein